MTEEYKKPEEYVFSREAQLRAEEMDWERGVPGLGSHLEDAEPLYCASLDASAAEDRPKSVRGQRYVATVTAGRRKFEVHLEILKTDAATNAGQAVLKPEAYDQKTVIPKPAEDYYQDPFAWERKYYGS